MCFYFIFVCSFFIIICNTNITDAETFFQDIFKILFDVLDLKVALEQSICKTYM